MDWSSVCGIGTRMKHQLIPPETIFTAQCPWIKQEKMIGIFRRIDISPHAPGGMGVVCLGPKDILMGYKWSRFWNLDYEHMWEDYQEIELSLSDGLEEQS